MLTAEDLRPGDLVAVPSSIGPFWLGLLGEAWTARAALFPVDDRLSEPEGRSLLERARPTVVVRSSRDIVRPASGRPVSPETMLVFATSGTAGTPKLVELSREAVRYAVTASNTLLGATEDDVWMSCLPPAHVGGMLVLLRAVFLGTRIDVVERFDPSSVGERPGQFISLVPTMLSRLLDARVDLTSYHAILMGGGTLHPDLRARAEAVGASIVETYGLTESCGGVVYDGTPFPGTDARIADGLIELRGPSVMTGYLHEPDATAATISSDGWLRTGDAGSVDGGVLRVLGRADDLIDSGGEKVWPQEVETALSTHPGVAEVAVAGRADPEWGQRVVAFVVPSDPAAPPSLDELRDHASAAIARFKAPREVVLLDALPRTASGKVRRGALSGERE
ncbi:MAG: class I adenylate-forming enzyme family protein [Actinomycetota bacterium]